MNSFIFILAGMLFGFVVRDVLARVQQRRCAYAPAPSDNTGRLFQHVAEEARREMARHYLGKGDIGFQEVAYVLV